MKKLRLLPNRLPLLKFPCLDALKILADDETLNKFKQEAFETAKQFDIHAILPQYENLYNRLIKSL